MQGGDSARLGKANYHPFYITSDKAGGFEKKIEFEKGKNTRFMQCIILTMLLI